MPVIHLILLLISIMYLLHLLLHHRVLYHIGSGVRSTVDRLDILYKESVNKLAV
jgi:hypothetical protein